MTIHEIKKNIIDRILDDKDILDVFDLESYDLSKLRNNLVFDYLMLLYGSDFISIDVSEKDSEILTVKGQKDFTIFINLGLLKVHDENENKLDMASINIEKIINELYPDRTNYKNIPIYHNWNKETFEGGDVIRQISFEIKE